MNLQTPEFDSLRRVSERVLVRAGELMYGVATGAIDPETMSDMVGHATKRNNLAELCAIQIVLCAMIELPTNRVNKEM